MKFLRDRKALETVEAAITLPIAILVMLATINLGLVVFGQQAVQAAARHGARMGSVAQQCPACYAVSEARGAIQTAAIIQNPEVTILAPGGRTGSLLKIRVTGEVPNGSISTGSSSRFSRELAGWPPPPLSANEAGSPSANARSTVAAAYPSEIAIEVPGGAKNSDWRWLAFNAR